MREDIILFPAFNNRTPYQGSDPVSHMQGVPVRRRKNSAIRLAGQEPFGKHFFMTLKKTQELKGINSNTSNRRKIPVDRLKKMKVCVGLEQPKNAGRRIWTKITIHGYAPGWYWKMPFCHDVIGRNLISSNIVPCKTG